MKNEVQMSRDRLAIMYLHQLQSLAAEISVAMEAIATNTLSSFQESVAKQEMLCASLEMLTRTLSDGAVPIPGTSMSRMENSLDIKIRETSEAIRRLGAQYAALLRHSGKSIALLVSLCKNHTGQIQEAQGLRLKHQTWSCEM